MIKLITDHPWIIVVALIWSIPWKGVALWRSARRGHAGWFFALLLLNTLAILDIIYIFLFSGNNKINHEKKQQPELQSQVQAQPKQSMLSPTNRPTIV